MHGCMMYRRFCFNERVWGLMNFVFISPNFPDYVLDEQAEIVAPALFR